MSCRLLLLGALAAVLGVAVAMALPAAPATYGRDEIDFLHLEAYPLAPGESVAQPVPLQAAGVSQIYIPYHLAGAPVGVRFQVATDDGRPLLDVVRRLPPSKATRPPLDLRPSDLLPPDSGTIVLDVRAGPQESQLRLLVSRLSGGGQLELYASESAGNTLPAITGHGDRSLAVATAYGRPLPAGLQFPGYLERVLAEAPPWLPAPAALLTLLAALAASAALAWLASRGMLGSTE